MRIVAISDTHTQHRKIQIPDGDVLIHAGDITYTGEAEVLADFNNWLSELPHAVKLVIAGNHDGIFEKNPSLARSLITNAIYLQDDYVMIEGLKFYGSPWTPRFFDWAFNSDRGSALEKIWRKIPSDTDVLITHGPAYGILDTTPNGVQVGCSDLKDRIQGLRNLKLHVFGHIHNAYGNQVINGINFVNAAICTENYLATNKPIVIEIRSNCRRCVLYR